MSDIDTTGKLSQQEIVERILNIVMDLDMVKRASFKSENEYETTPNQLTIIPEYRTSEQMLEMVGQALTKIVRRIYPTYEIKASIEYRDKPILDDEGNIVNVRPCKHLPKISIRWNSDKWHTEAGDVQVWGYSITPEKGEVSESPEDAVRELALIETLYNRPNYDPPELKHGDDPDKDHPANI